LKQIVALLCFCPLLLAGQTGYQKDFGQFWTDVRDNYAYFKQQKIDWERVKTIYTPAADTVTTRNGFIRLLERVLNELYNGHSSLNTNLASSNRLTPSGADMYVERKNGQYLVTDLRMGFGAELCGLKTGMQIVRLNSKGIDEQLTKFLPAYATTHTPQMYQYAIEMLFAGTHNQPRVVTVLQAGAEQDYFPDMHKPKPIEGLAEMRRLNAHTGYIKINNSLGDNGLITAFDNMLDSLMNTAQLVIDLTETPGGGNTTVARAIMGRFIDKKQPYQQHEIDETEYETKRSWVEYVTPRKTTYKGRLMIMTGHWTGSMGEGMAIGFDGMKRAVVAGTKMAGLIGAISGFRLNETSIGFQIPTEKLYHINGTPREDYQPRLLTRNSAETWKRVKQWLKI
jgi:C-terminal processing protease CtpA/Prc